LSGAAALASCHNQISTTFGGISGQSECLWKLHTALVVRQSIYVLDLFWWLAILAA
jgi:hypothetical protein